MLAPVAVFVYNRPKHTQKTINALSKNSLAKESEIYIFSDEAKDVSSVEEVNLVRKYIESPVIKDYFKSVTIEKAKYNKGLADSIISGVSKILKKYGKVIVLEDDLITSIDFLQYMNDALFYYENCKNIWSISGYTFNLDIPKDYKSEVYLSYRGCSWGWATWIDRWKKVDWNVSDYDKFRKSKYLRKKLNRGGRDMANMLDNYMQGKNDSWAIRWCYSQSKLDMLTVYPVVSRIKNIGLDGTGTHSGVTSRFDIALNTKNDRCNFDYPGLDKRITKNFKKFYMSPFKFFLSIPKKLLKQLIIKP